MELKIKAPKTYATADNARKAVAKTGDDDNGIDYLILQNDAGRWFPLFLPTESQMTETGIHFRWNVFRA